MLQVDLYESAAELCERLAVLNPAVSVALVLVGKLALSQIWIPLAGSLVGAVGAVLVFNAGHPTEECSEDDESGCSPI